MRKIINYQSKFLAWDKDVIILATQAGILAVIFSLMQVIFKPENDAAIFAMIGVFIAALVQTVGIRVNILNRVKASLILSIGAGFTTAIGCYVGDSFIATAIGILLLVPLVGLTSSAEHLSAAIILFTVDLFIIGSGAPSNSLHLAALNGCSLAIGSLSLAIIALIYARPFGQITPIVTKYKFSFKGVFINYQSNLVFSLILTIAVSIANAISYLFKMPQGFWIPMTALLILKADHDFTKSRMSHRLTGTLFGSLLAVLVALLISDKLILALMMLPIMFFIVISMARHYGAYTAILTVMVTVMMNLMTPDGYLIATHRLIDTLLGVITVAITLWILKPSIHKLLHKKQ